MRVQERGSGSQSTTAVEPVLPSVTATPAIEASGTASAEAIRDWIVAYIAELLEISPEEIDTESPFDTYGLDSSAAIGLTGELEDWLGKEVDPTLLYDYPTIESLVDYLSE